MRILSWNIKQFNFNTGKDYDTQYARILQLKEVILSANPDVIVIMEIRPGVKSPQYGIDYSESQGALATMQLMAVIGDNWQCDFSGGNALKEQNKGELYAVLWKTSTTANISNLETVSNGINSTLVSFKNRVPGLLVLSNRATNKVFSVMAFHAPNPSEMSSSEVDKIKKLAAIDFPNLILCGDFNFDTNAIAKILQPELTIATGGNGTSLKVKETGTNNPYDAIYFASNSDLILTNHGELNQLEIFEEELGIDGLSSKEISGIKKSTSDHAAVWAEFQFKP